jgi:hypothetical protein
VTFDKTPFLEDYKFLTINVAGNDALFWLGNLEGDPGLVERVAANTYFAFDGTAAATVTDVSSIAFSRRTNRVVRAGVRDGDGLQLQPTSGRHTRYMRVTGASRHLDAAGMTAASGLTRTIASDLAGAP